MIETNKRPNQTNRAIEYMKENGSLTNYEALVKLGIFSFAKRICEMRERGYIIKTEWEKVEDRFGKEVKVKRYYLLGQVEIV